jgi:hypothetical protein
MEGGFYNAWTIQNGTNIQLWHEYERQREYIFRKGAKISFRWY